MSQGNCTSVGSLNLEPCQASGIPDQKWYKPIVCISRDAQGQKKVFKTYRYSQGMLGHYFRMLGTHEYRMLKQVEDLAFTPDDVDQDPAAAATVRYRYITGTPIKELTKGRGVPENFFHKLYLAVSALHDRGLAHLDVGNSGNILASHSGEPVLIDFGSAIPLNWLPSALRRWAQRKDVLGVLKLWHRFDRETMPPILLQHFERHYRKNIYTPKRFFKAIKRHLAGESHELDGILGVVSLFAGLFILVSIV